MVCVGGGISGLRKGGITFGGLGLKVRPDEYSVRNVFEVSFAEEGSGKAIFEGGFNFSASEARKKFYSTASEVQRVEDRSAYSSTK